MTTPAPLPLNEVMLSVVRNRRKLVEDLFYITAAGTRGVRASIPQPIDFYKAHDDCMDLLATISARDEAIAEKIEMAKHLYVKVQALEEQVAALRANVGELVGREELAEAIDPVWMGDLMPDGQHLLNNYPDQHLNYRERALSSATSIIQKFAGRKIGHE